MTDSAWQGWVVAVVVLASALFAVAHLLPGHWRSWRRALAVRVLAGADGGWRLWLAGRIAPGAGAAAGCGGCDRCESPPERAPRRK